MIRHGAIEHHEWNERIEDPLMARQVAWYMDRRGLTSYQRSVSNVRESAARLAVLRAGIEVGTDSAAQDAINTAYPEEDMTLIPRSSPIVVHVADETETWEVLEDERLQALATLYATAVEGELAYRVHGLRPEVLDVPVATNVTVVG